MTLDPTRRSAFPPKDREFLRIVDEHGWHVTFVAPREGSKDKQEWWGYSTGIYYRYQQPEILLAGLGYDTTVILINSVGDEVKAGLRIEPDRPYNQFLRGYDVIFKPVHPSHMGDYVGFAIWFYERAPFPVLQMFFPDKKGKFPWEKGCQPEVKKRQPLLYLPKKTVKVKKTIH